MVDVVAVLWACGSAFFQAPQEPTADKILRDRATLVRTAQKPYGSFVGIDAARGELILHMEAASQEKTWLLDADAEVRVRGAWGTLDDLVRGDRLWVWARVDRDGKPRAVFMVADEISEQVIHQVPYVLGSVDLDKKEVVVRRKLDGKTEQSRTLKLSEALGVTLEGADYHFRPSRPEKEGAAPVRVTAGGSVTVRTSGDVLLDLMDSAALEAARDAQKARMDERWRKEGLSGTVGSMLPTVGELEVIVDHAAMRWVRALKAGDAVKILLEKPVNAAVLDLRPWNERTRLSLAAPGRDLADLRPGQRVRIGVPEPAADLLKSAFPPDMGRPREGAARIEWFLSSTYCSCSIAGDGCTGMFYTLSACNAMTCGMPKRVRTFVGPLVEKGLSDREILGQMEREYGPAIWKPHLLR
jgi:hypothetical protein